MNPVAVSDDAILVDEAVRLKAQGRGYRSIAKTIGETRHRVRHLLIKARLEGKASVPSVIEAQGEHSRSGGLVKYEALKAAIAAAMTFEEIKDIRDKAEALRIYARMANDEQLELDTAEIRARAERRIGELMEAQSGAGFLPEGRPKKNGSNSTRLSKSITLAEMGIDKHLADRARRLVKELSDEDFELAIKRVRDRMIAGKRVSFDIAAQDKKQRRADREASLGMMQCALPDKKYGVILADPEWRFEPWSRETGMDRAADNHYPTSCTEVIAARDVSSIAARDCILFLWATAPMLPHALLVMAAWGFDYRSHFIWAKDRIGTGYWNRNKHELLLVGVRGKVPAPAMGTQWESVIDAAVGAHSAKPERFLELIEEYFPSLPKIELNRRGPSRRGWDAWGDESLPPHDPETGEIIDKPSQDAETACHGGQIGKFAANEVAE